MANVHRSSWLSTANNGAYKQGTWPAFKGEDEANTGGGAKQQGIDASVDGHAHGINASLTARATRVKVAAAGEQSGLSTRVGDDPLTRSLPGGPGENTKNCALARAWTARLSALTHSSTTYGPGMRWSALVCLFWVAPLGRVFGVR
jgi:hypothetical protein